MEQVSAVRCVYCGDPAEETDHVVPRSLGGLDHWTNTAPACGPCNRRKSAKSLLIFLLEEGGHLTNPLQTLRKAAERYDAASLGLDAARKRLHDEVRNAARAGISKTLIAKEAGLSRQHVYELIDRGGTS